MNGFWAMAARDWPPSYPEHHLVASFGASNANLLLTSGVLWREPMCPWSTIPCTTCRADARIVFEGSDAVALCTGEMGCPDEDLGPTPVRATLVAADFHQRLAVALELCGLPGRAAVVTQLGRRRIGTEEVAFDLCSHPARAEAIEALSRVARGGPAVRVVLVPDSRRLPTDIPTEVVGVSLVWAGLNEIVVIGQGLRVDLRSVLARQAFRGFAPIAPFDGMVFDGAGAKWRTQIVVPPERARALRLLRLLAARSGEWVPRRELWRGLFPEQHTRTGTVPRGMNTDLLDRQLRKLVAELRAALRGVGLECALENQRGDEATGGYRLALLPEQVQAA